MKCVKGRTFLEVIRKSLCKLCANCDLTPHWPDCCFGEATFNIMIRFVSPERDYSLSKGGMTLEKGLRSQHSKDVQLHDVNELPIIYSELTAVNELPIISASM